MRASALLLPAALGGVALGILAADAGIPLAGWLAVPLAAMAVASLAAAPLMRPASRSATIVLMLAASAAALGAWRSGATAMPSGPDSVPALVGREWTWTGTLTDDPRPRADRQQVVLDDIVLLRDDQRRPVRGRILVWLPRSVALSVGERIRVTSRLEQPQDFNGFAYREYLARQGIGAIARAFDVAVIRQRIRLFPLERDVPVLESRLRAVVDDFKS